MHDFYFFDIPALPKCQKIKNVELDQYGPEHFEV